MPGRVFVDTAGWANLFIASESHHQQATSWFNQARQQRQEMVTTNYILLELVALLISPLRVPRPRLFDYVDGVRTAPYIRLVHIDEAIDAAAWALLKSREDKSWSLVDATSFVVMQQLGDFLTVVRRKLEKSLPNSLKDTQFAIGTRSGPGCYLYCYFYDYHRLNIQLFFDLVTDTGVVGLWLNNARHRPKLLNDLELKQSQLAGINTKWPEKGAWTAGITKNLP